MSNFLRAILVLLSLAVIGILISISAAQPSPREASLLAILLFVLSVLVTWIVAHFYAESSQKKALGELREFHQANLKTYALKAAEKVNNLSNQLNLLSLYLQEELDSEDYESPQEELLAKEERIASAIHITNTLKSVNDTGLSDWKGVIGEELDQQREKREEREDEIRELLERLQSVVSAGQVVKEDSLVAFHTEVEALKSELRLLVGQAVGTPLSFPRKLKPSRHLVEMPCPSCGHPVSYKQRPKKGSVKAVKCQSCGSQLLARVGTDGSFKLEKRSVVREAFPCPSCNANVEADLDTFPGSAASTRCHNCHAALRATRTGTGIRATVVAAVPQTLELTEEILALVQKKLPPQPWPKGTSQRIADESQLPHSIVTLAVQELIRRGLFNVQIDGKLYVPLTPENPTAPETQGGS
jgi:predicted RNA-binding Zn-ribbon protein involved in translation (DUF1610 family)